MFAHTCDIFLARGIANLETLEMSSLSVEEAEGHEVLVTLFEIRATPQNIQVRPAEAGRLVRPAPPRSAGVLCLAAAPPS